MNCDLSGLSVHIGEGMIDYTIIKGERFGSHIGPISQF